MSSIDKPLSESQASRPGDFEAVRKSIIDLLRQPDYDDGSAGPVLVRLAWHSSGTYDVETDTGGSNGAGMRYEAEGGDPANAGLQNARLFLEPVKRLHPWITYSDLWTLAGVTTIRAMGGPEIDWLPGRTDFVDDSKLPPRGRLPDAAQGADHIRDIFYRMGFNDREIVALSGAHSLGRCHTENSGFEGKWVNNPTRFSNQYFRLLLSEKWTEKTVPESGVTQFSSVDPDTEEELMMLPTDMALTTDPEFSKFVRLYADDKELFFNDFKAAFAKLLELGIARDAEGNITNSDNEKGGREVLVGQDLFTALYHGSPTERFDRIPFAYAIETALQARALRLCHAAYVANGISWTARIMPVHNGDELLCLVIEWEQDELHTTTLNGEITQSWLPIDDAFRILVQAVKDYAIFLLDTRGNVMTWNTGAELNKGYKKEEIIGKHFTTFYGEEDIQSRKPERELEICLREGRVEDEGWRYRKDGSRFWANVVITAIYKNDIHVGFGKVTRNLTERKEAELRLTAAYEESTKLKNDFLANMSHEIRTPMHGVLSACSLLLDSRLTEEQRETANMIQESGQVLLRIINDILDYSKIAAGTFPVENERLDIANVITSAVRRVQTTVQPGVSLKLNLSPNLPKWAEGDALRYRQIFENLLSNAVKFTERGYISVNASMLTEDETSHTIETEVWDTGHGVTEADAQELFKPFTQLDTPHQKRRPGTGLGLSIAKSLVELLGGSIGYKPNPERQGSIFWFSFKVKRLSSLRQAESIIAPPGGSSELPHQELQGGEDLATQLEQLLKISPTKRILAAEDNIINQKVLVGMLHGFGFKDITVVSDGAQAVSSLSAASNAFDLILMDISMPIMNGYEATLRIRRSSIRLPIIAMTAYALKGDMERCLEKGMDDYIPKPMDKQVLMRKLLKWLQSPGDVIET
ncbi:hypothetical protein QSH57_002606 [Fusarium oxysporum f. sp. vasinfectum]|nr:hypothetical protein QSH57_002606 [Fusarium oxysporum f. sp. vasinfectum]